MLFRSKSWSASPLWQRRQAAERAEAGSSRTKARSPQTNGICERFHKTLKSEAMRVTPPDTLAEARALVTRFVAHYNGVRLHSAIDYIAPNDMLAGKHDAIIEERDRRLEAARELRRQRRQELRLPSGPESEQHPVAA